MKKTIVLIAALAINSLAIAKFPITSSYTAGRPLLSEDKIAWVDGHFAGILVAVWFAEFSISKVYHKCLISQELSGIV